jgi:hypothetical protein
MAEGIRPRIKVAIFQCMNCGKKYFTAREAEKVAMGEGCKKCGSFEIDLYVEGEWFFKTKPMVVQRGGRV